MSLPCPAKSSHEEGRGWEFLSEAFCYQGMKPGAQRHENCLPALPPPSGPSVARERRAWNAAEVVQDWVISYKLRTK